MRHLFPTSAVPDEQMSLALARVHGRLRRRRNGLRGAGAAAMACVVLVAMGVAAQSGDTGTPGGVDAMESGAAPAEVAPSEQGGICGHHLAGAEAVGLDLTIRGPVEWSTHPIPFGGSQQVVVVARNQSDRPLTITSPASIVGLDDEALVITEPSPPVLMQAPVTLEPLEAIELFAGLPQQTCTGDPVAEGTHTLAPIVRTEDLGHSPVVVRGSTMAVIHR